MIQHLDGTIDELLAQAGASRSTATPSKIFFVKGTLAGLYGYVWMKAGNDKLLVTVENGSSPAIVDAEEVRLP